MKGVIDSTLKALQEIKGKPDVIYLVSDFGGYTYGMLKPEFSPGDSYSCSQIQLAVSQGAVLDGSTGNQRESRCDLYT